MCVENDQRAAPPVVESSLSQHIRNDFTSSAAAPVGCPSAESGSGNCPCRQLFLQDGLFRSAHRVANCVTNIQFNSIQILELQPCRFRGGSFFLKTNFYRYKYQHPIMCIASKLVYVQVYEFIGQNIKIIDLYNFIKALEF